MFRQLNTSSIYGRSVSLLCIDYKYIDQSYIQQNSRHRRDVSSWNGRSYIKTRCLTQMPYGNIDNTQVIPEIGHTTIRGGDVVIHVS